MIKMNSDKYIHIVISFCEASDLIPFYLLNLSLLYCMVWYSCNFGFEGSIEKKSIVIIINIYIRKYGKLYNYTWNYFCVLSDTFQMQKILLNMTHF